MSLTETANQHLQYCYMNFTDNNLCATSSKQSDPLNYYFYYDPLSLNALFTYGAQFNP